MLRSGEVFEPKENSRRAGAGFASGQSILPPREARLSVVVCLAAEHAWRAGKPLVIDS